MFPQLILALHNFHSHYHNVMETRKILKYFFKTIYHFRPSRKGYHVSYRETEPTGQSISGPFHGHGIYSYRPESSIYLPGRQSTYINNNPAKVKMILKYRLVNDVEIPQVAQLANENPRAARFLKLVTIFPFFKTRWQKSKHILHQKTEHSFCD